MRAELQDASLARYAGRFVWLDLNFDKPSNRKFVQAHSVTYTPSMFVLDPFTGGALATQMGGLALPELMRFIERGEREFAAKSVAPVSVALARGDEMLGKGRSDKAIAAYRDALQIDPNGPEADRAVGALTWTLSAGKMWEECALTASKYAPTMPRREMFSRVVLAGMICANYGAPGRWTDSTRKILEPLAVEAVSLPETLRDHRFQLYEQLMNAADLREDKATVNYWGDLWLRELDSIAPAGNDERSALDIARVDAASLLGDPMRVLPALVASEKAMPNNYNASLRLAQMENAAKKYDEAAAACDRGLRNVTGPVGRSWLFRTKAAALLAKGQVEEGRYALQAALRSAQQISAKQLRESNVKTLSRRLKEITVTGKSGNPN